MTGLTDYSAKNQLNYLTGQTAMPALPAVYLALFTAVGTDAGTGFTEASGTNYARVQVAGNATTNATTSTSSPTLHFASVPSWIVAGMSAYDATTGQEIGTVASTGSGVVTLAANASSAVGNGDVINFSAFSQAANSGPSTASNNAAISFATPGTGGWGTALAFGLYDASSSGNLLAWDYLGNYSWLPCTISSASPGVITAKGHGYSAADNVIFSTEYGGTAPSFSQSNLTGVLAVVSPTTDTFTVTNSSTAVNTSSTGDGMVRKIIQQTIPANVVTTFPASTLVLSAA